jgi:hypothetical protein
MARFLSFLLWTVVFLLIVLAVDQLLLRVPATLPAHTAVATFYRDLRSRLLDLATGKTAGPPPLPAAVEKPASATNRKASPKDPAASIEAVIDQRQPKKSGSPPPAKPATARPTAAQPPPVTKSTPAPVTPPASIEAVIDQRQPNQAVAPVKGKPPVAGPAAAEPVRRYLYADEQGNLHFAGTLSEVPERYRDKAKLVGE